MSTSTKVEYVMAELVGEDGKRKYTLKLKLTVKEIDKEGSVAREIERYAVANGAVVEDGIYKLRYVFDGQQHEHRKHIQGGVMRAA